MWFTRLARGGALIALTALGTLLAGAGPAHAATRDHHRTIEVGTVRIAGAQVSALSHCLADARDGVISTQRKACRRVAPVGGMLRLTGSTVRARHGHRVYSGSRVTVGVAGNRARNINVHITLEITGGNATAINNCVNDAQDGVITTQRNACTQTASAGNIITLENVTFIIYT
jgi:hypothetical protein